MHREQSTMSKVQHCELCRDSLEFCECVKCQKCGKSKVDNGRYDCFACEEIRSDEVVSYFAPDMDGRRECAWCGGMRRVEDFYKDGHVCKNCPLRDPEPAKKLCPGCGMNLKIECFRDNPNRPGRETNCILCDKHRLKKYRSEKKAGTLRRQCVICGARKPPEDFEGAGRTCRHCNST